MHKVTNVIEILFDNLVNAEVCYIEDYVIFSLFQLLPTRTEEENPIGPKDHLFM